MQDPMFSANPFQGNQDGGSDPEAFGAWSRTMQRGITPPMDTLSSILTWCRWETDTMRILANEWLYFSHRQHDAACNRWADDLVRYRKVMSELRSGIAAWVEDGEAWEPPDITDGLTMDERIAYAMLPSIDSEQTLAQAEELLRKLDRESRAIQIRIRRAVRQGHMVDYGASRYTWSSSDPDRMNNARNYSALGFFGQRFVDICMGNQDLSGQRHTQLIMAHMAMDGQGKIRAGDISRRRRGDGEDEPE